MTDAVLAVVKDFAVNFFVSVIAIFLFSAVELSFKQKKLELVWFDFFFFLFRFFYFSTFLFWKFLIFFFVVYQKAAPR